MNNIRQVSAAVLAGGLSSRMGINKAFVEVGGRPLIQRTVDVVKKLADDVFIIANKTDDYASISLPVYPDVIPGKGPLGGLLTALHYARNTYCIVVSCDQPFLNIALFQYMLSLRENHDVVVPLAEDGYPQSMHAIYNKTCLNPVRAKVETGRLKVIGFFPEVRVREVRHEEIVRFDPQGLSFINVNDAETLATAQNIAKQHNL